MSKNPFINALSASGYIILIVTIMNFIMQTQKHKPDTILAPITFLSLLTLSVAVMAYLFFYQPLQLFIADRKKEGITLFVKTVAIFGGITLLFFSLLLLGIIK